MGKFELKLSLLKWLLQVFGAARRKLIAAASDEKRSLQGDKLGFVFIPCIYYNFAPIHPIFLAIPQHIAPDSEDE
jgi:hypothetical protein